ncbi:Phenylalanyl-tRNA synthetase domain protein (Bsu YtpR) [Brachybacterium faecium]|nr:Phenylalanyl-tRNA synthetase domain protein (Bsu YtpR) [Brachybacterium faecium]
MVVNVFYNEKGIGDVLIVQMNGKKAEKTITESNNNVTEIKNADTNEVIGYNLFKVKEKTALNVTDKVEVTDETIAIINEQLSAAGFETLKDVDTSPKFVVGYVKSKAEHSNSDHLSVCQVDLGTHVEQIVCGAPNVDEGQYVVVAKVGAVMPSGLIIEPSALRGEKSNGMICAARELAIPDAPTEKGIMILEGSDYKAGQAYAILF